jgi:hypothetical protein
MPFGVGFNAERRERGRRAEGSAREMFAIGPGIGEDLAACGQQTNCPRNHHPSQMPGQVRLAKTAK